MSKKVCAFTGHRPQILPILTNEQDERCQKLKAELKKAIEKVITEQGITHFISGMALGVDTFAAETVLELKLKYPEITLECAIPCETQAEKWNEQQRDRYFGIVEKCDKETMLQNRYTPDCMFKRNRYMVYNCDVLIAVWDGRPSGTSKTVEYAKELGKEIIVINPKSI